LGPLATRNFELGKRNGEGGSAAKGWNCGSVSPLTPRLTKSLNSALDHAGFNTPVQFVRWDAMWKLPPTANLEAFNHEKIKQGNGTNSRDEVYSVSFSFPIQSLIVRF
jgi:hypothetical protein